MSAGFFGSYNWGEGMLPAFSGLRPGMLVNTLQRSGQPPWQRATQPKMSAVLTNPALYWNPHLGLAAVGVSHPAYIKASWECGGGRGIISPSHQHHQRAVSPSSHKANGSHHQPWPLHRVPHTVENLTRIPNYGHKCYNSQYWECEQTVSP